MQCLSVALYSREQTPPHKPIQRTLRQHRAPETVALSRTSLMTCGAVRTTPLPPLHEIAASYRARADGSVVFGADEAGFGPHLVTHPLTAAGLDAQLAGMLRGTAM